MYLAYCPDTLTGLEGKILRASHIHTGGSQNYGPLLGPLNTRCRVTKDPNRNHNLTTTHMILIIRLLLSRSSIQPRSSAGARVCGRRVYGPRVGAFRKGRGRYVRLGPHVGMLYSLRLQIQGVSVPLLNVASPRSGCPVRLRSFLHQDGLLGLAVPLRAL